MPFTPEYRAEIEAKLAPVESKVMFGGVALYSEGLLFALIHNDKLYFKVGPLNQEDYEEAGMPQFIPSPGARPMAYYELPPGLIENPEELGPWREKSEEVARINKAKAKSKKRA